MQRWALLTGGPLHRVMALSLRDLKCEQLELFISQTSHFSQKGLLHAHAGGRCCLHSRSLEGEGSVVPPCSVLTFTQSPVFTMAPPTSSVSGFLGFWPFLVQCLQKLTLTSCYHVGQVPHGRAWWEREAGVLTSLYMVSRLIFLKYVLLPTLWGNCSLQLLSHLGSGSWISLIFESGRP